jgi:hypothetical protein
MAIPPPRFCVPLHSRGKSGHHNTSTRIHQGGYAVTDRYKTQSPSVSGPATSGFAITPSDTLALQETTRGLYVGVGGDVTLDMATGETLLQSCAAGRDPTAQGDAGSPDRDDGLGDGGTRLECQAFARTRENVRGNNRCLLTKRADRNELFVVWARWANGNKVFLGCPVPDFT